MLEMERLYRMLKRGSPAAELLPEGDDGSVSGPCSGRRIQSQRSGEMDATRRDFLKYSKGAAAVGALAALGTHGAVAAEAKSDTKLLIGACGIGCSACPLMKAGKCKGCGPANAVSEETAAAKMKCPVFSCAKMKGIAYCGTDCKKFTECGKLIGRPYSSDFMTKIKTRLG